MCFALPPLFCSAFRPSTAGPGRGAGAAAAPAERRRNEFRRGGRLAPRRNPAAGGAAARRGRRGTGEARWWPGKKGGAARLAPCGAGPGPRPRPAGSEPQRGERWAGQKLGEVLAVGEDGRRGPLGKVEAPSRGRDGAERPPRAAGPGGTGCERRRSLPRSPPRRGVRRASRALAPRSPRGWRPPAGLQPGPHSPESQQDFSGQVPPKLGRGKELAVVLFPEARCLSASDGPLQT